MKKESVEFKPFMYPIVNAFFDADNIPCTFRDELIKAYPSIEKLSISYPLGDGSFQPNRDFDSFVWDIGEDLVLALGDAQIFIDLYNRIVKRCEVEGCTLEDVALSDIAVCTVCGALLFPDDECYSDTETGEPLCDTHSGYRNGGNIIKRYGDHYNLLVAEVLQSSKFLSKPDEHCQIYKKDYYTIRVYIDKDIWDMEIEESFEVKRGEYHNFYYIVDSED